MTLRPSGGVKVPVKETDMFVPTKHTANAHDAFQDPAAAGNVVIISPVTASGPAEHWTTPIPRQPHAGFGRVSIAAEPTPTATNSTAVIRRLA